MLEVERQNRILCTQKFFALDLKIFSSLKIWIGLKKRLPSCKLAATNDGVILSAPSIREMKHISEELEWMQMEEKQTVSAAKGTGGLDTDDETQLERMEPSSIAAAGDRLLVRLNSSYSAACPGDTRTATKKFECSCEGVRTIEGKHNFPEPGS